MTTDTQNTEHVAELISGYIDGELTQQERQRVDVHCQDCAECQQTLQDLKGLRKAVGSAELSELGEDKWREDMDDTTVKAARGFGWLLFIGGLLVFMGVGLFQFITDDSMSGWEKLLAGAIYGGMAALFLSALRQRLIERKTDKYKDVEI